MYTISLILILFVIMRWLLKCFYGHHNLWDEFLFWGVLDYIDTSYTVVDELVVEVADVEWMQNRWTRNILFMQDIKIAQWFISQQKIVKFIEISKDIRDNFRYDVYFFWWWEVFAESRWFHGGLNYLFRYFFSLHFKTFVLLWGIETPHHKLQKLLYSYILPKADRIVCRDQQSYKTAYHYNKKSQLYTDFVIPLIDRYRQYMPHHIQNITSHDSYDLHAIFDLFGKKYVLINMIGMMSTDHSYRLIETFVSLYPNHKLIYVSCGTDDQWREDKYYARWLQWVYSDMVIYDREEYSLVQTLWLFHYASAGIWCRLHFLLLLQALEKDRYALAYAEKIKKLITSTLTLS